MFRGAGLDTLGICGQGPGLDDLDPVAVHVDPRGTSGLVADENEKKKSSRSLFALLEPKTKRTRFVSVTSFLSFLSLPAAAPGRVTKTKENA